MPHFVALDNPLIGKHSEKDVILVGDDFESELYYWLIAAVLTALFERELPVVHEMRSFAQLALVLFDLKNGLNFHDGCSELLVVVEDVDTLGL